MDKAGITLSAEEADRIDWPALTLSLSQAVIEGVKLKAGDLTAAPGFVMALKRAGARPELSLEAKAFNLLIMCFTKAFTSLREKGDLRETDCRSAVEAAVKTLEQSAKAGGLTIPQDFYDNPAATAPYRLMRDVFLTRRTAFRPTKSGEAQLKARFDGAFIMAVYQVLQENPGVFECVADRLGAPALKAANFEFQWRAYRQSLINDFHNTPVFGQEDTNVSLGQLYAPLRCFWREDKQSDEDEPRYPTEPRRKKQIAHVRRLDDELDDWLNNDDPGDWLRLIGGGPGSGKSTSARAFADRLARRDDLRPLFIPIGGLTNPENRLRSSINAYFTNRSGDPFRDPPLDRNRVESNQPLVLILDGLDELAIPGKAADDIARDMMGWIESLHTELTGFTKTRHRVLVTGRMPSFQAARRRANGSGREGLEVLGFLPLQTNKLWRRPKAHSLIGNVDLEIEDDKGLLAEDERIQWWKKYAAALGLPTEPPEALRDERLDGLTAEPLLCYLLALSGHLEGDYEAAAENRNIIYEKLLSDVWDRGWGPRRAGAKRAGAGRAGPGKDLSKDHFNRLFETMALAAWHGGEERVATQERFENALQITRANDIYTAFKNQEGDDVSNLAVNFYMKHPEADARGFEFTHKSFGEYLTARALIRLGVNTAKFSEDNLQYALSDWLGAVNDGELTPELLDYLRDEARLLPLEKAQATLRRLERMMSSVIADGLPAHKGESQTWRGAETRQRKAETMLMALMHVMSERIAVDSEDDARIRIDWKDNAFAFGDLLRRILTHRQYQLPETQIFARMNLKNADLRGANLRDANLWGASLRYANLEAANLANADLRYANLRDANLRDASLRYANLRDANLRDASLRDASLRSANLRDANLRDANLWNADLRGANLRGADLRNADLRGANLEGANLMDVDLDSATLKYADFGGANLEGTILDESS